MADDGRESREAPDVRASDGERRQVIDRLATHFAEGRLTADELADRLDGAHRARTRADLARLESDLPELVAAAAPAPAPATLRRPGRPTHALLAPPLRLLLPVVLVLTVLVASTGGFPWPLFLLFAAGPFSPCGRARARPHGAVPSGR